VLVLSVGWLVGWFGGDHHQKERERKKNNGVMMMMTMMMNSWMTSRRSQGAVNGGKNP
jgi:hypothetical protein